MKHVTGTNKCKLVNNCSENLQNKNKSRQRKKKNKEKSKQAKLVENDF